jgi:hypothetical protein
VAGIPCGLGRRCDLGNVQSNLFERSSDWSILCWYVIVVFDAKFSSIKSIFRRDCSNQHWSVDQTITSLSTAQLCSPCMIALLQTIQSTPYSNYGDHYVQDWVSIQSRCNTGPLPTQAQPPATNMTAVPGVTNSNPANVTCLSGNHYTRSVW